MEEWKDIPGYEGYYQASNLGRVRSLDRTVITSRGKMFCKGRIREVSVNKVGYKLYCLSINGIDRTFQGSQLVAMAFLGHKPNGCTLVVDHINGNKSDDRVENLRIVTNRANTTTCFRSDKGSFSSEYIGVLRNKRASKWQALIQYNGVRIYLGLYNTEIEASIAYQSALSKIEDGSFNADEYKPKWASEYKGVSFYKAGNKWSAYITINGKRKHLGYYHTELEAYKARLKAKKEQKSA